MVGCKRESAGRQLGDQLLYAGMLDRMGVLFGEAAWRNKAEGIKGVIRQKAFDGKLFRDRAIRDENGALKNTDELSEVTQYYALRFGTADIEKPEYAELRRMVFEVFGPRRDTYANIEKADMLPGIYLRMELLLQRRMPEKLLNEIKLYFLPMARETGTLWENCSGSASRNHGFASYVAVAIAEALRQKASGGILE